MTNDLRSSLIEMYREHLKTCDTPEALDALSNQIIGFANDLLTLNDDVRAKDIELAREAQHE